VGLETDVVSVAKLRLADERAKMERVRQAGGDVAAGSATVSQLVTIYRQRLLDRQGIAEKTRISAIGGHRYRAQDLAGC